MGCCVSSGDQKAFVAVNQATGPVANPHHHGGAERANEQGRGHRSNAGGSSSNQANGGGSSSANNGPNVGRITYL